nr:hypothetical protein [Tanacetum cinerariifolium]
MIPEPCDTNREVPVNETFHVQTGDELTKKELKQIEADDQAIQTILLGFEIGIQEKKAKLFNEWERKLVGVAFTGLKWEIVCESEMFSASKVIVISSDEYGISVEGPEMIEVTNAKVIVAKE